MVVKAKSGRHIELTLDVGDCDNPENNYYMRRGIVDVDTAKAEVDEWWKHIVKILEWTA